MPVDTEASIHPSIWVSTPEVVATIERGIKQFYFLEISHTIVNQKQKEKLLNFGAPQRDNGTAFPAEKILIPADSLDTDDPVAFLSREVKGRTLKWMSKSNPDSLRMNLLSENAWWRRSVTAAYIDQISAPESNSSEIVPTGRGVFQRGTGIGFVGNPFDLSSCGRTIPDVSPAVKIRCDDTLIPKAREWFDAHYFSTIIGNLDQVYDPPLSSLSSQNTMRAGRREVALPEATPPSPRNPIDVSMHHEGILFAIQIIDREESLHIRLIEQFRPRSAGPVPWQGLLTNYAIKSGDIMGFFLSQEEENDEIPLVLVRVVRNG